MSSRAERPGAVTVLARATDDRGHVQPLASAWTRSDISGMGCTASASSSARETQRTDCGGRRRARPGGRRGVRTPAGAGRFAYAASWTRRRADYGEVRAVPRHHARHPRTRLSRQEWDDKHQGDDRARHADRSRTRSPIVLDYLAADHNRDNHPPPSAAAERAPAEADAPAVKAPAASRATPSTSGPSVRLSG